MDYSISSMELAGKNGECCDEDAEYQKYVGG
jgi:hypothetical protein